MKAMNSDTHSTRRPVRRRPAGGYFANELVGGDPGGRRARVQFAGTSASSVPELGGGANPAGLADLNANEYGFAGEVPMEHGDDPITVSQDAQALSSGIGSHARGSGKGKKAAAKAGGGSSKGVVRVPPSAYDGVMAPPGFV